MKAMISSVLAKAAPALAPKLAMAEAVSKYADRERWAEAIIFFSSSETEPPSSTIRFNLARVLARSSEIPMIFFAAAKPPTVAAMPFSLPHKPSAAVVPSLIRRLKRSCWLPASRIFCSMESKAAPALASSSRASWMDETSTEFPEARCMASKLFSTMFMALCMA